VSRKGLTSIVVELLKHDKVDVNLQDNRGCKALIEAWWLGCIDTVFGSRNQTAWELKTRYGATALMLASRKGHTEIVVELLKHDKVM
jgi:serine/threonine-protein phosphatase 6 regulatory ankyrin repeat subunit B